MIGKIFMDNMSTNCPKCGSDDIVKHGKSPNEKQRYLCQNTSCNAKTFIKEYEEEAKIDRVRGSIIDNAILGNSTRDISKLLQISENAVINEIKKSISEELINFRAIDDLDEQHSITLHQVFHTPESQEQVWNTVKPTDDCEHLWYAVDQNTGNILLWIMESNEESALKSAKKILKPLGVHNFHTDDDSDMYDNDDTIKSTGSYDR
tara:strand:+ start:218 stop:835 length:618 start_codon:yes stop_codon:yes gene_type:complete